ncbi:hypothetical protein CNR22_13705 [Sphingobacteriaceae bacterium]|nr:hypothetical protein CNR22_13705 [Sphingobacteriaceae bacterium]
MNKPIHQINDFGLLVADRIEAMLAYWDKDQVCKFANSAYMKWFGKSKEEMIDKITLKELLGPLYEQNLLYITEALKGHAQQFELEKKTSSGESRTSLANYYPDLYEGNVRGFSVHITDITTQKKREESFKQSEDKFRSLFNFSPIGMVLTSAQGKFLEANPAVLDVMGLESIEELTSKPTEDYYVEPDERLKMFDLFRRNGFVKDFEFKVKKKNGELAWISNNIAPYQFGNNDIQMISSAVDITKRKNAEEALADSEKKYRDLINFSPAGITISNIHGEILEANQAIIDIFGFASKEEFLATPALELYVNKNDRAKLIEVFKKDGTVKNYEIQLKRKNGEIIWVSNYLMPFEMPDGEKALLSTSLNITELKKIVVQLQDANKELEAFTYSVSHDLRAPLRAVNGYAQMLNEDYSPKLDGEGKRVTAAIRDNAIKMGILIDELLAFSRLGRKEVQRTNIDMNELVESVIHDMDKALLNKAEIRIGKLHGVEADYSLLSQVMINLISNALKYSSKKEHPVVEIFSEEKQGEIIFSVKDNGAGFDMKYSDKLFGVFQRLHKQNEFEGVGVGLAIVQRIIAKHSGRVWAISEVNEGAIFNFSILNKSL